MIILRKILYLCCISSFIFLSCIKSTDNENYLKGNSWYKSYIIYKDTLKYSPPMTIINFQENGICEDCSMTREYKFECLEFKPVYDIYYPHSKWLIENDSILELPFGIYTILKANQDSLVLKDMKHKYQVIEVWKRIVL